MPVYTRVFLIGGKSPLIKRDARLKNEIPTGPSRTKNSTAPESVVFSGYA